MTPQCHHDIHIDDRHNRRHKATMLAGSANLGNIIEESTSQQTWSRPWHPGDQEFSVRLGLAARRQEVPAPKAIQFAGGIMNYPIQPMKKIKQQQFSEPHLYEPLSQTGPILLPCTARHRIIVLLPPSMKDPCFSDTVICFHECPHPPYLLNQPSCHGVDLQLKFVSQHLILF